METEKRIPNIYVITGHEESQCTQARTAVRKTAF